MCFLETLLFLCGNGRPARSRDGLVLGTSCPPSGSSARHDARRVERGRREACRFYLPSQKSKVIQSIVTPKQYQPKMKKNGTSTSACNNVNDVAGGRKTLNSIVVETGGGEEGAVLVSFGIDDAVVFAYEEVESVPSLETDEDDDTEEEEEEEEEDWESEDEEGE